MQISQNILFPCDNLGELGRAGDCFTLGYFGVVVKSPIVGGDDLPMERFP